MVFSSNEFLFLYLPLTLAVYFASPKGWRNPVLLLMSLAFYAFERPVSLAVMLGVIGMNYLFGLAVARTVRGRTVLACAVFLNLSVLGFFKYADFLLENLARIPAFSFIKPLGIALPIGISFYIFQSLSYVVDVYRGDAEAQRSPVDFGTYVAMFPQLIAGPIVRYGDVERELYERDISLSDIAYGARRFIMGLAKKAVLADRAGEMWESIRIAQGSHTSVMTLWLGLAMYSFQIYFDFSGYSDMAIGLGRMLGFHFPENFDYPYISKSVTEFWRRWHITLSSFFREYLYFPLGGSRQGMLVTLRNLLAVWLLTGLWHGASWNFVAWGAYYFTLLALEKLFLHRFLEKLPVPIRRAYTLLAVAFGWLVFYFKESLGGLALARGYFCAMLGMSGLPFINEDFIYVFCSNFVFIAALCLLSTPILSRGLEKLRRLRGFCLVRDAAFMLIFVACIAYITSSGYKPNIYFEF